MCPDHHLLMLRAVAGAIGGEAPRQLDASLARLLRAGQSSYKATRDSAKALSDWLTARKQSWLQRSFTNDEIRRIRKAIAKQGADGRLNDYSAAEQAFTAIESLSLIVGDADDLGGVLDGLFESVETERGYTPGRFRSASKKALARM